MKPIATAALLLSCVWAHAAQAQPVYRCGNAYSQTSCPQATLVEVADARSAAQQAEAGRVGADQRRLAAEMRRDRLADERLAKTTVAVSLSGTPAPKGLAAAPQPPHKKKHALGKAPPTTDFIAFDPSRRKRRNGA